MSKEKTDYSIYVEKMNNSQIFINMAKSLGYEKVGLQILNDSEEVVKEFTSHQKDGKISVKEGLENPEFTIRVNEDVIKQMSSKKEQAWMQKNPIEAAIKYSNKVDMPFLVKLKLLRILSGL